MKKVSLLIAMIAFVFGNAFAQFSYDFNDGTAGAKIAQTYGDPWTVSSLKWVAVWLQNSPMITTRLFVSEL